MAQLSNKEQCKEIADLMREGAKKAPQTFNGDLCEYHFPVYYATCALGAVIDGLGLLDITQNFGTYYYSLLQTKFPVLSENVNLNDSYGALMAHIESMNDLDHSSREMIADCIEALEW